MKIENFKLKIFLLFILLLASFLRFCNLMFDAPHFFNPDERNMANSIVQLRVPLSLKEWPKCIVNELGIMNYELWKRPEETIEESQRLTTNLPAEALAKAGDKQPDCNLHPHFFAYGQFPLYLSFFSDQLVTRFTSGIPFQPQPKADRPLAEITDYSSAVFWLRFWSALSSVGTVLVVYLITNQLTNKKLFEIGNWKLEIGHYAALLAAFTPGLIQSAHFGTTESLLTFFFMTSVYLSLRLITPHSPSYLKRGKGGVTTIALLALIVGCAAGTKLTGLFCLVPPGIAALTHILFIIRTATDRIRYILKYIALWLMFGGMTIGIALIASPYNIIDFGGFTGSVFGYEKDVATGEYRAFYTRQFENTIPVLFQMEKVFPYTLGWPIFIIGLAGFIFSIGSLMWQVLAAVWREISRRLQAVSSKQSKDEIDSSQEDTVGLGTNLSAPDTHHPVSDYQPPTASSKGRSAFGRNCQLLILLLSFLVYLIPNSILYAKWTRFLTPIFPFFAIFTVLFFQQLYQALSSFQSKIRGSFSIFHFGFCILAIFPGIAFFSIYLRDDVRVTASKWIYATIPDQSYILFDTGNVIDIPLGLPADDPTKPRPSYTLISFDFYHVDENPDLAIKLLSHVESADYIFIPSRRIFINHRYRADEFPITAAYYRHVFDGSLGFEKVAEFSSFPALGRLQFPDEQAEESFTVFDHPVVRIYKKTRPMSVEEYRSLLQVKN